MRMWWLAALFLSACASAPTPRFQTGSIMVLGSSENQALAAHIRDFAQAGSEGLAACFDDLAERTDTDSLLEAALFITARESGSVLADVRAQNSDTFVDSELRRCLAYQLAGWRTYRGDASLRVLLRVSPRRMRVVNDEPMGIRPSALRVLP